MYLRIFPDRTYAVEEQNKAKLVYVKRHMGYELESLSFMSLVFQFNCVSPDIQD